LLAEQRRERFLTEFTQSYKYTEVRNRLQEAIFRLGVEKFKKQVGGGKQLDLAQKNKFKAELYIFLQKKLKECLSQAIEDKAQSLPTDIVA
jgi:NAD(P)H-nitrite reductase large subunit